jgi:hypothetical protein
MRHATTKIIAVSFIAFALSACGSSEVKTGSLTQTYSMTDAQGVHFGIVELDPINGGIVKDSQGRPFARVVPYAFSTAANQ